METIADLLQGGAEGSVAIGAPEKRQPLRYGELRALVAATIRDLNTLGIGRGDRVVTVIPNGPEAATAFISVAAGATAAPLSRGLTADEFRFNLVARRAGRRGPGAAHFGVHLASEDRTALAAQRDRVRPEHPDRAAAHLGRCLPEHHAAVPHPRPDGGGAVFALRGRPGVVLAPVQCPALLPLARRGPAHLVHGGADHAPGDPLPRLAARGGAA